jgi:hypothetical protein
VDRFLAGRLASIRDSFGTGYVIRTDDYRRVGGIPALPKLIFADDVLWMKLAENAGIRILEEFAFSYRLHPASTSHNQSSEEMAVALSRYLDFAAELGSRNPRVRHALETYAPEFVLRLADGWMCSEVIRATKANSPARVDVLAKWKGIQRETLIRSRRAAEELSESSDLTFALWVNDSPARRRLFNRDATRRLLRLLYRTRRPWPFYQLTSS